MLSSVKCGFGLGTARSPSGRVALRSFHRACRTHFANQTDDPGKVIELGDAMTPFVFAKCEAESDV